MRYRMTREEWLEAHPYHQDNIQEWCAVLVLLFIVVVIGTSVALAVVPTGLFQFIGSLFGVQ